ncbi:MAG: response regulator transcription factor [Myxococcota bacterium]|nr:response regulator transcription factor [Myxococcota bacterium]
MVREGIRRILDAEPDVEVVAEASNGQEAVDRVLELQPDLALIDITMPRLSGIEAIRRIRKAGAPTRCLALSMHETHAYVTQALQAGAAGYVVKSAPVGELLEAVRAARGGKSFLSPSVAHLVVEAFATPGSGPGSRISLLTDREREVLQLVAEGLSSKEIAEALGVSLKTIESHRANLMEKLNIRKTSKLVRVAIHEGLVAL